MGGSSKQYKNKLNLGAIKKADAGLHRLSFKEANMISGAISLITLNLFKLINYKKFNFYQFEP